MATYEKRLDAQGRVRAIRVKLRRVGLPHLSRSFPVTEDSAAAVREAERDAERWVEEMSSTLAGDRSVAAPAKPSKLKNAWRMSQTPNAAASALASPMATTAFAASDLTTLALSHADTPEIRALILLAAEAGLSREELALLRWQWIQLADATIAVPSPGGLSKRLLPLPPKLLDALLAMGGRKYGLVFTDVAGLENHMALRLAQNARADTAKAFSLDALRREAARRWLAQGVPTNEVAYRLDLYDVQAYLNQMDKSPGPRSGPTM